MKYINTSLACAFFVCVLMSFQSCKKSNDDTPKPTVFTFTTPDEITFEYSGSKLLTVAVQNAENKEFGASLSGLNAAFSNGSQQLVIPSNQERSFNINFNQIGATPGIYPCVLTIGVFNENNYVPQTKTINLVYTPNCAYNYRNYLNGEITYEINGILLNKSISCSYNNQGQLVVSGLTTFPVVLNFDCQAQTCTMQALTHLGFYVTGNGYIQGQYVMLNMYDDGVLSAVARIKP